MSPTREIAEVGWFHATAIPEPRANILHHALADVVVGARRRAPRARALQLTPLALGSDAWSQVIVALSIFGPLVLTAALVVWVIRGGRNDPDELRRRRVQAEHRARSQRPGAGATIDGPTQALRARSPELLRRRILQMLLAYDARDPAPDARDLQWSLAPYHDCARRLALDPIAFFDEVAAAGPSGFSAAVGAFGQRTDTAPDVFGGYALTESPDGPTYVWA